MTCVVSFPIFFVFMTIFMVGMLIIADKEIKAFNKLNDAMLESDLADIRKGKY